MLPSEPRFDSNCITPGTEFMARLHEHLKYFVNKKLSTDPAWQRVEVILSGQDVSVGMFCLSCSWFKCVLLEQLHVCVCVYTSFKRWW